MWRRILLVIKVLSYVALAFVLSGIAALTFVNLAGGCPRLDEGAVQCNSAIYANIGVYGLFVLLMSAFTGLPVLLAIAGAVFLVRDLASAIRRRAAPPPLPPRAQ